MQAISIRQPEAWLILNGYKDIENRTRATNKRGYVAIHAAAKRMTREDWDWLCGLCEDNGVAAPDESAIKYGGVIGAMEITDCVTSHPSPWFEGQYGYVIGDTAPCEFLPCAGRLGWFEVPIEMEDA